MSYTSISPLIINFYKSFFNLRKKLNDYNLENLPSIELSQKISFSLKKLHNYCQITRWKREEIHPVFPYALLTNLHFSLVNDKNFPFSPFGMIHKKETIECFSPLVFGEWTMTCKLHSLKKVESGFELEIITDLFIDKKLAWRSITLAIKKTKEKLNKNSHAPLSIKSDIQWKIPSGHGLTYGLITHNVDPIHISKWTAKIMGHHHAIMHGMWTLARGVSEFTKIKYPLKIEAKFVSPIYLPGNVLYKQFDTGFGVYSTDGQKAHILVDISNVI
jgi:hypothetical protein